MTTADPQDRVTLTHCTIDGQPIAWDVLFAAANQDGATNEVDDGGSLLPPKGETQIADAYRDILRDALVSVRAAEADAYERYCTTGADAGSRKAQAVWGCWQNLRKRINDALR